nr:translation initiation factor IF-2-like [Saimiri boliviensis boliviensis]
MNRSCRELGEGGPSCRSRMRSLRGAGGAERRVWRWGAQPTRGLTGKKSSGWWQLEAARAVHRSPASSPFSLSSEEGASELGSVLAARCELRMRGPWPWVPGGYFHSRTTEAGRRPQAGARRQEGSVHRPRAAVQNVPSSAAAPASRGPGVSASLMGVGFFPAWDTPEPPFCARSGQRPGATSTARLSGAWRQPAAAFPSPGGAEPPASPTGHGPRAFDPRPRQQDRPCHCGRENVADAPRGAQASPARNRHGSRQRRRRWEPRWNRCAEHGGPRTPVTTTSPQSPG